MPQKIDTLHPNCQPILQQSGLGTQISVFSDPNRAREPHILVAQRCKHALTQAQAEAQLLQAI